MPRTAELYVLLTFLSDEEIDDFKSQNIAVRTYLLRMPDPGMGVYLTLQTSIDPAQKGYPIRMTAAYAQIDEKKINAN